jgi:hypothetical protein
MVWLLALGLTALTTVIQAHAPGSTSIDVSLLAVGAPSTVTELDLGKLKGEPRELAWAADGTQFYLQTVERKGKTEVPRHYLIAASGGAVTSVDAEPAWATEYWRFKSDRYAPGNQSLVIDVKEGYERAKYGTGPASDPSTGSVGNENFGGVSATNVSRASVAQTKIMVSLVLLDETIGTWVDQRPTPGTTFSWGPTGSGAMVFVDEQGRLVLLDSQKHKQRLEGTKDAALPAWTTDGSRLAWLAKSGRNKYTLVWAEVSRR